MNDKKKWIAVFVIGMLLVASCSGQQNSGASQDTAEESMIDSLEQEDQEVQEVQTQEEQTQDHQDSRSDSEWEYPLSNPNASDTTQRVYEYLCELSGNGVLSAQQESTWMGSVDYEMNYIYDNTGKYPAMRGLDYMHDDFEGVHARAFKWWNEGGLVTICWHTGYDFNGEWVESLGTEIEDWDLVLTEGTPEHEAFLAGMDKAAEALGKLQDEGVTVLWRPFHEFDGAWFWWGKGGSERFVELWRLMYDRYTNVWGLNNLIWVLGYSGNGKNYDAWYPGDDYVDILGADSYEGGIQGKLFDKVKEVTDTNLPLCFHECGTNPTAEEFMEVHWIWFMTWHTEYVTEQNTPEALSELYQSDYVITKDELPSFVE